MKTRVHPVVAVLALFIAIVAIAMVYVRRTETPKPISARSTMPPFMRGGGGRPGTGMGGVLPGGKDTVLGVELGRSDAPQGLKIKKFVGPPEPSPLKVMGVKEGDVITSCNGSQQRIRNALVSAISELQSQGRPITLVIHRNGKEATLTRTEKLPAESLPKESIGPRPPMGRGPSRPGGRRAG